MHVLAQEQDRLLAGETLELIEQCRERPAALLNGAERQRRIPLAERDRQQRGKKRRYGLSRDALVARSASSLSRRCSGVSSVLNLAARSNWAMNGRSALLVS